MDPKRRKEILKQVEAAIQQVKTVNFSHQERSELLREGYITLLKVCTLTDSGRNEIGKSHQG